MLLFVGNWGMRISVEMDDRVVREIMEMTGERKMSAAIAKAAEMFSKRHKAVAMIRTLRENPVGYGQTNEELEAAADPLPRVAAKYSTALEENRKNKSKH